MAVPIGEELRASLAAFVELLRQHAPDAEWRWTDPQGWHVTLAFLGSTDPARVPDLGAALSDVASAATPFDLHGGRLGAFSSPARARVVWYGFDDADGQLRRLAGRVRDAVGIEPVERFRAHLTLARARDHFGTDARGLLQDAVAPAGNVAVDRVVLYRSHLGGGPAHYEALAVAPLMGAAS